MGTNDRRDLGHVFNQVPELYDRVRPNYPSQLFADLVELTGMAASSSVLEVGCGTGQATRPLAELGCRIIGVEPGEAMAALCRERLAGFPNVDVETASFETWEDGGRQFDFLIAASSWHWVDPAVGWRKAHNVLSAGGWMVVLGNVVVRLPGEIEVYAETADLHQRFSPGNPDWGHPPREHEVRATSHGWGPPNEDREGLFGPTNVRWYPMVQWFDADGFTDHLRSLSVYRSLPDDVRERLLHAIADRIRTQMNDRVPRRYLSMFRAGRRNDTAGPFDLPCIRDG